MALDSRGNPTVKAIAETYGGGRGTALAPSGASRGGKEVVELRDGGRKWGGKGVSLAIARLNHVVAPKIEGLDSRMQGYIDQVLEIVDGRGDFSFIGGNVATAVSVAVAKAAADTAGLELFEYLGAPGRVVLPTPLLNIINGGVHAGNELDIQEFMIIPVGADTFLDAIRLAVEVYHILKSFLKEKYGPLSVNVGDEGGFAPPMKKTREALEAILQSIRRAGYQPGTDLLLGIDAAGDQLLSDDGVYAVDGLKLTPGELVDYYVSLSDEYPIAYIEDPFAEADVDHFFELTSRLSGKALIVGDDLYCTNPDVLRGLARRQPTNAALLKVNQVGTLSRAIEYAQEAHRLGMAVIVSHRSGDTEDPFIADLAVALSTGLIKTGAPARGERTSKYNRLLEIEYVAGGSAAYAGPRPFPALS